MPGPQAEEGRREAGQQGGGGLGAQGRVRGHWVQRRTGMGWRDVDKAGFRAQGLLGLGAAGGQARSPVSRLVTGRTKM